MKTYLLFDSTMTVQGTPEQITEALWRNCKTHKPLLTVQEYMQFQRDTEKKWSGKKLDTSSFEAFVESLVKAEFLIPLE